MKACSIQPKYPHDPNNTKEFVSSLLTFLDHCDDTMDLILLPEACNAPSHYETCEEFLAQIETNTPTLLAKASQTAKRCRAAVVMNLYIGKNRLYRNTTLFYGTDGEIKGKYLKQHLPVSETKNGHIDKSYVNDFCPPPIITHNGVRYGFLTCYDTYFDEYTANIARQKPDVVLISSLQRGEQSGILAAQVRNIAFHCNAYVVRASVSMGSDEYPCGASSMIVSPKGEILGNMGQQVGMLSREFDPSVKHNRENGYLNGMIANDLFIANGRVPWNYRSCGPQVCAAERDMRYPRICSHRGFNTAAPENTMAAFGLSVGLGTDEIELDLWPTRDGRIVVCHDSTVDRTSDGHGQITALTYDEISRMNIGAKYPGPFDTLRFPLFEEVLKRFSRQTIINIHIKSPAGSSEYCGDDFRRIVELIYRYDCQDHVYIAGEEDVLITALRIAPDLPRCALDGKRDFTLIELAKKYQCRKVQLFRDCKRHIDYFNQEMIDEANALGIHCNIFWSDDPKEAVELIKRGVSTILTNDYLRVSDAVYAYREALWADQKKAVTQTFADL